VNYSRNLETVLETSRNYSRSNYERFTLLCGSESSVSGNEEEVLGIGIVEARWHKVAKKRSGLHAALNERSRGDTFARSNAPIG